MRVARRSTAESRSSARTARSRSARELIEGAAERYRGFKCPHCRLFVPAERTDA